MLNTLDFIEGLKRELPITDDIKEFAIEEALSASRYIFVTNDEHYDDYKKCYCTHCKQEFRLQSELTHHKDYTSCPICGSEAQFRFDRYSRTKLIDEAYFVFYQKSHLRPNGIIARGIYCVRNYAGDYTMTKTRYIDVARYHFEVGEKTIRLARDVWGWSSECLRISNWDLIDKISSHNLGRVLNLRKSCSYDSVRKAVKGTPFEHSTWDVHHCEMYFDDMAIFFNLFAKSPCIEYLTKLGFKHLIKEKLWGQKTYRAVNWRGNSLEKVLKLSKQDIMKIKQTKIGITFFLLRMYQLQKEVDPNPSPQELKEIERKYFADEAMLEFCKYAKIGKIIRYLQKQSKKNNEEVTFRSMITTLKDYYSDCVMLGLDMTGEQILFPKNLIEAHQETIELVEYKTNELQDQKISKRLERLEKKYHFEYNGLIIRPIVSTSELIKEGKKLKHCVGKYSKRYAEGTTDILVIRRADHPNISYYTVEIFGNNNTVNQISGYKNRPATPEIREFMQVFKDIKLDQQTQKIV